MVHLGCSSLTKRNHRFHCFAKSLTKTMLPKVTWVKHKRPRFSSSKNKQFVPCAASCCVVDWQRGMKAKLEVNSQWASPFLDQVRAWHWPDFLPVPGAWFDSIKGVKSSGSLSGGASAFDITREQISVPMWHVTVSGLENQAKEDWRSQFPVNSLWIPTSYHQLVNRCQGTTWIPCCRHLPTRPWKFPAT